MNNNEKIQKLQETLEHADNEYYKESYEELCNALEPQVKVDNTYIPYGTHLRKNDPERFKTEALKYELETRKSIQDEIDKLKGEKQ